MSCSRSSSPVPPTHHDPLQDRRHGLGLLELIAQPRIADRETDPGLLDGKGELAGAQQRHGRDRDAAGLHHGKIDGDQHRIVGGAQQHAIAGDKAEAPDQEIGDPVHQSRELAIAQALGGGDQAGAIAVARLHPAVEQLADTVQAIGVAELRPVEKQDRPLLGRRQAVADEAVDMGAWNRGARDHGEPSDGQSGKTAMAWISTLARSSTRADTSTAAMAGKLRPITSR